MISVQYGGLESPGIHYSLNATASKNRSLLGIGVVFGNKAYESLGGSPPTWIIPRTIEPKELQLVYHYIFGRKDRAVHFFLENSFNIGAFTNKGWNDYGDYPLLVKVWGRYVSNCIGPGIRINYLNRMYTTLNLDVGMFYGKFNWVYLNGVVARHEATFVDAKLKLSIGINLSK